MGNNFILVLILLISWTIPVMGAGAPRVRLAENGAVLIDDRPFLPIFVWAQPSKLLEFHKALGINTIHPGDTEEKDPTLAYLDRLHRHGMFGLLGIEKLNDKTKGHPALLAWTVEHEPDIAQKPAYVPDLSGQKRFIWIEGEDATESTFKQPAWLERPSDVLSGRRWLGAGKDGVGRAVYKFNAETAGSYHLWLREFNKTWANPTIWALNDSRAQTTSRTLGAKEVVNFGAGRGVGWAYYGRVQLLQGRNTLFLEVAPGRTLGKSEKEPGKEAIWAVDTIFFTMNKTYPPAKPVTLKPTRLPSVQKANYDKVKRLDRKALTWNILTARFFGRYHEAQKLPMKYYRQFLKWTDIVSFDHYPVTGWNKPNRLPEVGLATRQLVGMARKGQPVWTIIEASDQDLSWTPKNTRGPTPAEMRASAWMAIANGAKGIGYFTIAFNPFRWINLPEEIQEEMRRTNSELTALTGPIVMGDTDKRLTIVNDSTGAKDAAGHSIQAIRKEYGGRTYIIAVNVMRKVVNPIFKLQQPPAGNKATVWKEERTVEVDNGAFTDAFQPLAVRVYVIN